MVQPEGIRTRRSYGHILGEKTVLVEQKGNNSAVFLIGQRSTQSIRHRQPDVVHQVPDGSTGGEARRCDTCSEPSFGMAKLTFGFPDRGTQGVLLTR